MAMIVVGILDPIRLILVLAIVALWRSPWAILVATLVSALVSETLLTATQLARVWGYGIAPGLVASLVQAARGLWPVQALARPEGQGELSVVASPTRRLITGYQQTADRAHVMCEACRER